MNITNDLSVNQKFCEKILGHPFFYTVGHFLKLPLKEKGKKEDLPTT